MELECLSLKIVKLYLQQALHILECHTLSFMEFSLSQIIFSRKK